MSASSATCVTAATKPELRKMLRLTLIDAGGSRNEINEPLGIESLAGQCLARFPNDVTIKLLSMQFHDLEMVTAIAGESDVVGISVQLGSLKNVTSILSYLHSCERTPFIILGSVVPTFAAEHFLTAYPNTVCVVGEGEEAVVDVITLCLQQQEDLGSLLVSSGTPNLALYDGNSVISTQRRVVRLDRLASPLRDLLAPTIENRGIVRIEASRGCPWGQCSFCSVPARYGINDWRAFPNNRVVGELQTVSQAGSRMPYFTDEDFFGRDYNRAVDLADAIANAKGEGTINPDLQFFVSTSVDSLDRLGRVGNLPNLIERFRLAGLAEMFLGLESGCKAQLKRYRKGITPKRSLRTLQLVRDAGIMIDIGFIMFDPEMSADDLVDNINFLHEARLDFCEARLTKPLRVMPDTPIMQRLQGLGLLTGGLNVDQLTYDYRFFDPVVQVVFDAFTSWETEALKQVYDIQARMRGEVVSESLRQKDREILSFLRNLDLRFIRASLAVAQYDGVNDSVLLRRRVEESLHLDRLRQDALVDALQSK